MKSKEYIWKVKKEKVLQKRDRDNPVNFQGIHSLFNRFEVFWVYYLGLSFITLFNIKTFPEVTVLDVTNTKATKCNKNTIKWNK